MSGFITLHRKLIEWEWYTDTNTKVLFLHLLLTVNWEDKKWRGIEIKRGSIITSISHLSKQTNLSYQNVRTALNNLTLTNEVNRQSTNKYTLLTVVNYEKYQDKKIKLTNKQQSTNKQLTTTKQYNNIKSIYIPDFLEFKMYAISKSKNIDNEMLKLKYESWKVNGWKDGNNKPIKNWKSKLLNTIPFLTKKKTDRI